MINIIECEEFNTIQISVNHLLVDGEVKIDSRTSEHGFINIAFNRGQVIFRADRYVGLIPINSQFAIRVRPRTPISNIVYMLVKSGVAPIALPDYSRGYIPRFEIGEDVERVYYKSLVLGIKRIIERGFLKSYVKVNNPPAWRGRLLVSNTVSRYVAKGVHYKKEFDFNTLSVANYENIALKEALIQVMNWLITNDRRNVIIREIDILLSAMEAIPRWEFSISSLIAEIGHRISFLSTDYIYYNEPLWTAYLLLQSKFPELIGDGFVSLDSLVVDISKIFEAYIRRVLSEKFSQRGLGVKDGNINPTRFFVNGGDYRVHPDIIITQGNTSIAILDVKYKPEPKESDRYEVISFMDVVGVNIGGFICPQRENDISQYMGETNGGKRLSLFRFNLSAIDAEAECDRLFNNICRMIDGDYQYI